MSHGDCVTTIGLRKVSHGDNWVDDHHGTLLLSDNGFDDHYGTAIVIWW